MLIYAFGCHVRWGHSDVSGCKGQGRPWAGDQQLAMDKNRQKYDIFVMVQYGLSTGQKTFLAAATSSNHTF